MGAAMGVALQALACSHVVVEPAGPVTSTGGATSATPCLDTGSDPENCGACGHTCLGGACVAGACQAVRLTDAPSPRAIAVDADAVYWSAFDGGIYRVARAGGSPATVVPPGQALADSLAVDAAHVYWPSDDGAPGAGAILRSPKAPGAPDVQAFVSGLTTPDAVAVAGGFVYFGTEGDGVGRVPIAGGAPTLLWKGDVTRVTVDATHAYVTVAKGSWGSAVVSVPLDGGAAVTLSSAPDLEIYLTSVAVSGGDVFWISGNPTALRRVPAGGGATTVVAAGAVDLAADEAFLYWLDPAEGRVRRAPLGGGAPEVLAVGQSGGSMAVDEQAIYWTNWGQDGAIMMLAR